MVNAQLFCEIALFTATCDGHGAKAHLHCELHPEMAQAADALNGHKCVRLDVQVAQRVKRRDAGAEQRGRV